jgi:uncharacterized membrane protein
VEKLWKKESSKLSLLQRIIEEGSSRTNQNKVVRIAVYEGEVSAPKTIDISANDEIELLDLLGTQVYQIAREKGSLIPYTAIKEVVENLLHAYCKGVVVSILDDGQVIRVADQGPGIADKEKAFQPGFTTATPEMRRYIRGVGSGLPLVKQILSSVEGQIFIEDNLERGTVVTLFAPKGSKAESGKKEIIPVKQKKVLFLLAELGPCGPSKLAHELNLSLSTIYRNLKSLEKKGYVEIGVDGKRTLTERGIEILDKL